VLEPIFCHLIQEDRLWATTVPKLLVDIISIKDRKRQENIYEFIYTEKDFVDDLVYLKTVSKTKGKKRGETMHHDLIHPSNIIVLDPTLTDQRSY
jgi:hypothetical protein